MHISRIIVRNFRNFAKLDLALGPQATCVLGENNSGKSNLFYALRLVLDGTLSSRARVLSELDFSVGVDPTTATEILVAVEFRGYEGKHEEEALVADWGVAGDCARLTFRFRPSRMVRDAIRGGTRASNSLTLDDYWWQLVGGQGFDPFTINWDEDVGTKIDFGDLQSFEVSYLRALRDVEQDLRRQSISPLQLILSVSDMTTAEKSDIVKMVRDANTDVRNTAALKALGNTITSSFLKTVGTTFGFDVTLGMSDPSFSSIAQSITMLLSDGPLKDFDTARNGLGMNNVLYVSMLLAYFQKRMAKHNKPGQLLLVEEPEAHLHPQLQRVLYRTLCNQGVQTLLTTHSTHISSGAELSNIATLTRQDNGLTFGAIVGRGAELTPRESADLGRYLDATRSTLLFAKKVILVEGPAELLLLGPLIKAVMGVDLVEMGVSVVPVHGTHFGVYTKLFSDKALPKRCAVVADGDRPVTVQDDDDESTEDVGHEHADAIMKLQTEYVKVFLCSTTFERALAIPGTLDMLATALDECGSSGRARKVRDIITNLGVAKDMDKDQATTAEAALLEEAGGIVLRGATAIGKARFAQVAARHVNLATELPKYIQDAVTWIQSP